MQADRSILVGVVCAGLLIAGLWAVRPAPSAERPRPPRREAGQPRPEAGAPLPDEPWSPGEAEELPPAPPAPGPSPEPPAELPAPPAPPAYDADALAAALRRQDAAAEALLRRWRNQPGPPPEWLPEALAEGALRAALVHLATGDAPAFAALALAVLEDAGPLRAGEGQALLEAWSRGGSSGPALLRALVRLRYEPLAETVARRLEDDPAAGLPDFRAVVGAWPEHPLLWDALDRSQRRFPEDAELAGELTRYANRGAPEALDRWRGLLTSEVPGVRRQALANHVWGEDERVLLEDTLVAFPRMLGFVGNLIEMPALRTEADRQQLVDNLARRLPEGLAPALEEARQKLRLE